MELNPVIHPEQIVSGGREVTFTAGQVFKTGAIILYNSSTKTYVPVVEDSQLDNLETNHLSFFGLALHSNEDIVNYDSTATSCPCAICRAGEVTPFRSHYTAKQAAFIANNGFTLTALP